MHLESAWTKAKRVGVSASGGAQFFWRRGQSSLVEAGGSKDSRCFASQGHPCIAYEENMSLGYHHFTNHK
jgi:hypothetical protein